MYMNSNAIGIREWRSYASLILGIDHSGVYCLNGSDWLDIIHWAFATIVRLLNYYFEHFNNHI